jgi:hypothetical protein
MNKSNRSARLIDPGTKYLDVTISQWRSYTKREASRPSNQVILAIGIVELLPDTPSSRDFDRENATS